MAFFARVLGEGLGVAVVERSGTTAQNRITVSGQAWTCKNRGITTKNRGIATRAPSRPHFKNPYTLDEICSESEPGLRRGCKMRGMRGRGSIRAEGRRSAAVYGEDGTEAGMRGSSKRVARVSSRLMTGSSVADSR